MSAGYLKHLIECNCILPQFKHSDPPKWHHFVVFSEFDENGEILPSFAQCNNCGVIHKVVEVGISSTLKRDNLPSLLTKQDILGSLPDKLQKDIEKYNLDLPTLQEIAWIRQYQAWGRSVILTKEWIDGIILGKTLLILGDTLWKISTFQYDSDEDK